jgi:hypothetical protein
VGIVSKYDSLGKFLREQLSEEVPMTFAEIERVTGVKLPPKAQLHRAWWSNNPSNNVMTKVWLEAGFRSEQVDMTGKKLVFKRVNGPRSTRAGMSEPQHAFKHGADPMALTHPMIGALKGLLMIEPGYDLTQPAMSEWAELVDRKYGAEEHK